MPPLPSDDRGSPAGRRVLADLRSDTLTTPTPAMREAMYKAEVGDDFLGEDPTAERLETKVCELFRAEAAVFVPSGRMANLISLRCLTQPGDEVICHEKAHFVHYEGAALAAVCGAQPRPLPGRRGVLEAGDIERAIRGKSDYLPRT
ncbi:MAG: threonine aldolase family protein, partial [Actinomycetota bacterium]